MIMKMMMMMIVKEITFFSFLISFFQSSLSLIQTQEQYILQVL